MLIALNKPYGCLSQFTPETGSKWDTLARFGLPKGVYPIGRLDADSEGLLLLSDEQNLVDRLLNPKAAHKREYWVQVERIPAPEALAQLASGVTIGGTSDHALQGLAARSTTNYTCESNTDSITKKRSLIAGSHWSLSKAKTAKYVEMTAAVGHPTLRLLRVRIGSLRLDGLDLPPGAWRQLTARERTAALGP